MDSHCHRCGRLAATDFVLHEKSYCAGCGRLIRIELVQANLKCLRECRRILHPVVDDREEPDVETPGTKAIDGLDRHIEAHQREIARLTGTSFMDWTVAEMTVTSDCLSALIKKGEQHA